MTWARLDDAFRDHPKFLGLSLSAVGLWACGLAYCSRYLTDGFIPKLAVDRLAPGDKPRAIRSAIDELLNAGAWEIGRDGGYQVHDFLDWNPSKERVLAARDLDRKRKIAGGNSARNPNGIRSEEVDRIPNATRDHGRARTPIPSHPIPEEIPLTPAERGDGISSMGEPQHDGRNPRARGTSPRQLAEARARAEAEARAARYAATPEPEPPPPRPAVLARSASEEVPATPAALATLAARIGRPGAFQ